MRVKLLVVAAVLMIAGGAEAGLSKPAQEWRRGPEKFLMSDEEEKAWKGVTSDAAAAAFIDLFWARRDPTLNTPRNEFREEFLTRVRYADAAFPEKRRRGALTDRGQVYILLGPPDKGTRESMTMAGPAGMGGASARSADAVVWTWPHEFAASLGVPKIFINFTQIVGTDTFARDTKFGQFSNVSEIAIRKNILHPEMTAAPEWALRVSNEVFGTAPAATAPRADVKAAGRIGRLVLLSDLGVLNLDAATDPIASLKPVAEFAPEGDLAFVLEYCGSEGVMKVETKINEMIAASELEPAPMKAVAGCGALPGMLSLSGLDRGSYTLEITTIEPAGGRLTTKQRFQIK
jgi:GWxTD domain-containing protein